MQVSKEQAATIDGDHTEVAKAVRYAVNKFRELTGRVPTVCDVNLFVEGDNLISVDVKMEAPY